MYKISFLVICEETKICVCFSLQQITIVRRIDEISGDQVREEEGWLAQLHEEVELHDVGEVVLRRIFEG